MSYYRSGSALNAADQADQSSTINHDLRLLTACFMQVRYAMFGFTCRTTIIFETPKDNSLKINSLQFNACFSNRNVFQIGVNAFVENGFKILDFLSKSSKLCTFRKIRFGSNFANVWFQVRIK